VNFDILMSTVMLFWLLFGAAAQLLRLPRIPKEKWRQELIELSVGFSAFALFLLSWSGSLPASLLGITAQSPLLDLFRPIAAVLIAHLVGIGVLALVHERDELKEESYALSAFAHDHSAVGTCHPGAGRCWAVTGSTGRL
jgi:hypothetical protein